VSNPVVPDAYRALIESSRVSTGTRAALLGRMFDDDRAYRPVAMSLAQLDILRAVLARVLPQPDNARIDLAARIDAQLHAGPGDGWRFAALPGDRTAYARGLAVLEARALALHRQGFAALTPDMQDNLLARTTAGELAGENSGLLDATQMRLWFEDVRNDAVKIYMAHPATLARLGYSGIGYGGDDDDKRGFSQVGLGEREEWEPTLAGTP
jgi:hypothetical protein